ncbi:MAG: primosomal protein N', partial [Oscillospiraceae bacterium]
ETEIIDMRGQKRFSQNGLSDELLFEIEKNIKNNEQTIILNNRRGFNTTVTCKQCGFVEICPNCSIALTYHKPNESLMCHYCGYSKNSVTVCSVCGADTIKYSGSGTQTIENTLNELFPSARILRMDQDTTMAKFSHDKFFKEFSDKKYDILVGTQMVAKGLNFPDVTLVGVLGADKGIFSGDFKGAEKTFSLITQVVGRAGRGEKSGRALIQTTDPDNYVITYGCKQDYNSFYEEEIAVRKLLLYPPFCDICTIGFSAIDENITSKTANSFSNSLKQKVLNKYKNIPIKILGPSKTTIYKINNKYRQKIIIKCKNNHIFKSLIMEVLTEFYSNADFKLKKVSIIVDFSSDLSF